MTLILKNIKNAIILRQVLIRRVLFSLLLLSTFTDSYSGWKSEKMRSTESVRLHLNIFCSNWTLRFVKYLICYVCHIHHCCLNCVLRLHPPKSASLPNFTLCLPVCTCPIHLLTVWTPLMQINTQHRCGWKPALNRRWKMWNGCQISTVGVGQRALLVYDLIPAYLRSYGWVVIKQSCAPDVGAAKVYWVRSHRHTGATWRSG